MNPQTGQQQIDIWCAEPDRINDEALLREYRCLLTDAERAQELRMHFAHDRRRYLVTRAMVRIVLSKYARIAPDAWVFTSNRYGKPAIANENTGGLTFNLTHAGRLIILCVAYGTSLGVDTEHIRAREHALDLVERCFTSDEASSLYAMPVQLWQQRFFEHWTLKEAYVKARGMGMSIPLDQVGFRLDDTDGIRLWVHRNQQDEPSRWHFWQLWPDADHIAAVCIERTALQRPALSMTTIVPWVSEHARDYRLSRTSAA
ncbi:4'-phosphopantetheinyl transferase superfamily protein [Paraburkholderia acidicola]|uniref:4'-phosphopantetheinyl transferase superfamily protein n=1 Tax=Paraburkholderia acidicola TaxID=1912599 RepID=A0ABV1LGI3_9BURK